MSTISQFRAVILPPAGVIATGGRFRPDIDAAGALYDLLKTGVDVNAPAVVTAKNVLTTAAQGVLNTSRAAADTWVDNALLNLTDVFALDLNNPGPYANDILYIVSTPEFALNGWIEGDLLKWDGFGIIPQTLEAYIRERVKNRLQEPAFQRHHVLFTFSCCSYTDDVITLVDDGGVRRIAFSNRITAVVNTAGVDPRTVSKFVSPDTDGWVTTASGRVFAQETVWNANTGAPVRGTPLTRTQEVTYVTPFANARDGGQVLRIGLCTCQDVQVDLHPNVSLVSISGAGCGFVRNEVKDTTHPFIYNDRQSWLIFDKLPSERYTSRELWAAGYYQDHAPPAPAAWGESVQQRFAGSRQERPSNGPRNIAPRMANLYMFPVPVITPANYWTAPGGVVRYYQTVAPTQIPPRV